MATKAQLETEVDRLKCELMRYAGLDVDTTERVMRELAVERTRAARLSTALDHMIRAITATNEASAHYAKALTEMLEASRVRP